MKIALFGGTFDPVHGEHLRIVRGALKELNPDKLIVMPAFCPPHKAGAEASFADRLEMCRLAFAFDERIEISAYEAERQGESYTYLTAQHLKERYPEDALYLVIGGDSFISFEKWVRPEVIVSLMNVAVVARGRFGEDLVKANSAFERKYGRKAAILSFNGDDTSSTYIRALLSLGETPANLPPQVAEFIAKKGLYRGDDICAYVREALPARRRVHTAGVIDCALALNRQVGEDPARVRLAALLHDVAKYMPAENFPLLKLPEDMPTSVRHAFVGEYVAREILGVKDEGVLDAIRYHTTGRAGMAPLEKLIYTADLIERNRTFSGVSRLREIAYADFEAGFRECVLAGVKQLKQSIVSGNIYYLSEEAYNYYK